MTMAGPEQNCCFREQVKYSLYVKLKQPRLYSLASKGNWEEIPKRCKTHPKEAKFVHRYPPSDTALHQVIRFPRLSDDFDCDTSQLFESLKLDAVKALMEANRNAASATDSLGRTPLHLACIDICASEVNVGNTLLEAWPQACAHQDLENRTPLHYLMARNDDIPIMFLEKLLKAHSDARNIKDIVGETPLQILEARAGEVKNAEAVMEVMKRAE